MQPSERLPWKLWLKQDSKSFPFTPMTHQNYCLAITNSFPEQLRSAETYDARHPSRYPSGYAAHAQLNFSSISLRKSLMPFFLLV